ncbi:MAG: hypothetical protein WHS64_03390 [Fervidobacterium sp.]|uniref:Uncharacterized protein n=1 Tax=Fervidobacterium gondwanense DSM 13020 TaxID=1121883 RepID=A0A1M7S0Q7_FERGO|nr:hypothetical protein [Fervidobacterium gondwanense]UXF00201.1 hypothetical protein IB67_00960 [Fervidobacterium riparium]SHN52073.1 hypothetical protein SAMN02745226_00414 [Fervidobacterium gondwanense DSM 13020]
MFSKSDKSFFLKFPVKYLILMILGIIFLFMDFSNIQLFSRYSMIVEFAKMGISIVFIITGLFEMMVYLFSFAPISKYDENIEKLKAQIVEDTKKRGETILGEFISFRPWMDDEYYVKAKNGIPKYFYPIYYVILSIKDNMLNISEYRLNVYKMTHHSVGYQVIPSKSIISQGFTQDRVLFSSVFGESASTTYFLEIRTLGGTLRIPILEEEISESFGDMSSVRNDFFNKIGIYLKAFFQKTPQDSIS